MPQFHPAHTPSTLAGEALDEFTRGYLDCAEWLLDDEVDRDKLRGWTKRAIGKAAADCAAFQRDNASLLERYEDATGRDMASAGHDFFLTRNGHGTGFWDRGDDPVLETLSGAASAYGQADAEAYGGWLNWR